MIRELAVLFERVSLNLMCFAYKTCILHYCSDPLILATKFKRSEYVSDLVLTVDKTKNL